MERENRVLVEPKSDSDILGPDGNRYPSKERCDEVIFDSIKEAFDLIFQGRKSVSLEEFQRRSEESYQKMNLTEYARAQNLDDVLNLVQDFLVIRTEVPEINENDTIFVGGCGDGRLLEAFLVLSKIIGVKKVVLNDISSYYLGKTREKLEKMENCVQLSENTFEIDGVICELLLGDIKDVETNEIDNVIAFFSLYYASSEFGDISSPGAMTEHRNAVGKNINKFLAPDGIWIEEIPDTDKSGLFRLMREMSTRVFEEIKIFLDEDQNGNFPYKNISLVHWGLMDGQEKEPAQLRITPINGFASNEKLESGFEQVESGTRLVPKASKYREDFAINLFQDCETIPCLEDTVSHIRMMVSNVITYPSNTDPYAKRTKKTVWRKIK